MYIRVFTIYSALIDSYDAMAAWEKRTIGSDILSDAICTANIHITLLYSIAELFAIRLDLSGASDPLFSRQTNTRTRLTSPLRLPAPASFRRPDV